jgi:hypothetical protein
LLSHVPSTNNQFAAVCTVPKTHQKNGDDEDNISNFLISAHLLCEKSLSMGATISHKALIAACVLLGCATAAKAAIENTSGVEEAKYHAKYLACLQKAADQARANIARDGASDPSQVRRAIDECGQIQDAELTAAKGQWDCTDKPNWILAMKMLGTPSDVAHRLYEELCPAKK